MILYDVERMRLEYGSDLRWIGVCDACVSHGGMCEGKAEQASFQSPFMPYRGVTKPILKRFDWVFLGRCSLRMEILVDLQIYRHPKSQSYQ